jgi:hypothetical protein
MKPIDSSPFQVSTMIRCLIPGSMISWITSIFLLCFPVIQEPALAQADTPGERITGFSILWKTNHVEGEIRIRNGNLQDIHLVSGKGKVHENIFRVKDNNEVKLEVTCNAVKTGPGSNATLIHVLTDKNPFSFFLRDVNKNFPIYVREYEVIVTTPDDTRRYHEIESDILDKKLELKLNQIQSLPEYSFDSAARVTRDQPCPTWLGISRDARIFQVDFARKNEPAEMGIISPRLGSQAVRWPEGDERELQYGFVLGRGVGPVLEVARSLDQAIFPILHTDLTDEDITYQSVCFASLENSLLSEGYLEGTNYLVADSYSYGHMFTEEQKKLLDEKKKEKTSKNEETVLYFRAKAINNSLVPRYAWFKTVRPGRGWWDSYQWLYDRENGFSSFQDGKIFGVSKLNGESLPDEEVAILLQPGDSAIFEFCLPHVPVSKERAMMLKGQDFTQRYEDCKKFWDRKIKNASTVKLPEKRIQDMMNAGLLHLDLITYGNDPEGILAPSVGVYSPIGTESSPIIQYYNSRGWQNIARRSIEYFLAKQHDDGMIQNFGGYMVETGAALWTMGEYFRYTRDSAWVKQFLPEFLLSCKYLVDWREENKIDSLKGNGYGMITGRVADPADDYHQFMLNAYGYLGLSRMAEMLYSADPANAARIQKEAQAWRSDIRESLFHAVAYSPVVPLGDGSWCPTVPPWTESMGLQALFVKPGNTYSHGTFTARDVMLGPLYLIFCEILDVNEELTGMMLKYQSELLLQNNAAFSQPYYSRHAWLQLKKDLIKPFLKTYYTTFSALADRETYSFWEHFYHVSPHKTHEEGWFLMQSRWMLYMEEGDTLKMLRGIPRRWLEDGKEIILENMATYFGPVTLEVHSDLVDGVIRGTVICQSPFRPHVLAIRLPHPFNKRPVGITGGFYKDSTETLYIDPSKGKVSFQLAY